MVEYMYTGKVVGASTNVTFQAFKLGRRPSSTVTSLLLLFSTVRSFIHDLHCDQYHAGNCCIDIVLFITIIIEFPPSLQKTMEN